MILKNYCFGEVLVRDSLVFHLVSSLFFSTERQTALKNDFERVLSRYNDADFDTKRRDVKSGGTKKNVVGVDVDVDVVKIRDCSKLLKYQNTSQT